MKDNFNLSYIQKASKRLTFFSEFKLKQDFSYTEATQGFKLKFAGGAGAVTGYGTTSGKFYCTYQKVLEGGSLNM